MDEAAPAWSEQTKAWVAAQGISITGEVTEPHHTPRSTALRLRTSEGIIWLTVASGVPSPEPRLLQALAAYDAPHVLRPLAVDADRGWLLLPDGGPTLRSVLDRDPDLGQWERALPRYAELQRAVERRALPGTVDQRPERLPALLDGLLGTVGIDAALLPDLRALQPRFTSWCDELASSAVLPTLEHGALHDGNVFTQLLFFDFKDAALACPLSSLLVTLRSVAARWSLEPGAPELRRLRDSYLEAWTDLHTREELELLTLLATRVGKVGKALAWRRALAGVTDPGPDAEAAPGWVEELLEPDIF